MSLSDYVEENILSSIWKILVKSDFKQIITFVIVVLELRNLFVHNLQLAMGIKHDICNIFYCTFEILLFEN